MSPEPRDSAQVAATLVNRFYVEAGPIFRISYGETRPQIPTVFRGALAMTADDAVALAMLILQLSGANVVVSKQPDEADVG